MALFSDFLFAVFTCCSLVLFGVWCWVRWKHRDLIRAASNIHPIFPTLPILGCLHHAMFGIEKLTGWLFDEGLSLFSKGIYTTCFWVGPFPIIVICGVDEIQKVNSTMKIPARGFDMDFMKFILGNGLLTAPVNIWKTTRRALDSLFHSRNLKQLIPTFNGNSRELVERLSQYDGKGAFDVFPIIIDTSLQTICHLIFGPELEFQISSEEFQNLVILLKKVPEIGLHKVLKFWLQSDVIFNYLYKEEIEKMNLQWEKFSKAALKMARDNNDRKNRKNESFDEGPLNLINVYSLLQQNFPDIDEKDLKAEIITMYLAGSDTVSYAVSSCLLLLAYHQDIQEKLLGEISSVTDSKGDVTIDDLQRMTYLDQVFKETLRLSIVIPFSSRRASEDIKLSSCTIPKGSTFILSHVGPFLDSKTYPDPTRFNPNHFSPDNSKGRDKSAFLPFNAGPRHCIGKLYAELLAKIIVVHVLRKFKLSTTMDVYKLKRKMAIFVYNSEGYNISIQHRTQ